MPRRAAYRATAVMLAALLIPSAAIAAKASAADSALGTIASASRAHDLMLAHLLPPDDIENLREAMAHGLNPDHPLVRALERSGALQFSLEEGSESETHPFASPAGVASATELGADALVNARFATCSSCANHPVAQVEPSVAIDGNRVVVAFNDNGAVCYGGTRENYAYSTDGGATFTYAFANLSTPTGTLFGDPSVAVNHKSGKFYLGGLCGNSVRGGFDIGAVRGSFSGNTFVVDLGNAPGQDSGYPDHFFDRPFMAVDSLTGNVYFTWADFHQGNDAIDFLACDSLLQPLGPVQVLAPERTTEGYQSAQPVVGPNGVVYVAWWVEGYTFSDTIAVRRSDDHGMTFGSTRTVAAFVSNFGNPPPGMQRAFGVVAPSIAVDNTNGPYRGRVYVAWDAAVDYLHAPYSDTTVAVGQTGYSYADATPIVPGGKIRGVMHGTEHHYFSFTGTQGQTLVLNDYYDPPLYDSTLAVIGVRIHRVPNPGDPATDQVVSGTALYANVELYGLPSTATYYVELYGMSSTVGSYVVESALINPTAGGGARDQRDQMVASSVNGVFWSTPRRLVDDAPGFDGAYPSLAVDGEGRVHATWLDYREDTVYGTTVRAYGTASGDGGVTWGANRRLGDAASTWPAVMCISNANSIGDYMQIAADGDRVVSSFTDPRFGDSDILADPSVHALSLGFTPSATATTAQDTVVQFSLGNTSNYARTFHWSVAEAHGWVTGASPALSGTTTLAIGQPLLVTATVRPRSARDSTRVSFRVTDPAIPGRVDSCATLVHSPGPTAVTPAGPVAFFLSRVFPNPTASRAECTFGLPRETEVRLGVYDLRGGLVRELVSGRQTPGLHRVEWDGRDERGRESAAGMYFVRLHTSEATRSQTLIRMR